MVNFRRAAVLAVCTALTGPLLTGCGFVRSGTAVAPREMAVSSDAFGQGMLPREYTCLASRPVTPPVTWSGAPSNTAGYALVVDDSSAPITPYIYWIVVGIQPGTTDIARGGLPQGAHSALNSAGVAGYTPPCPRGAAHKFRFTVYALSSQLDLPAGATIEETWQAIARVTIGRGRAEVTANP